MFFLKKFLYELCLELIGGENSVIDLGTGAVQGNRC